VSHGLSTSRADQPVSDEIKRHCTLMGVAPDQPEVSFLRIGHGSCPAEGHPDPVSPVAATADHLYHGALLLARANHRKLTSSKERKVGSCGVALLGFHHQPKNAAQAILRGSVGMREGQANRSGTKPQFLQRSFHWNGITLAEKCRVQRIKKITKPRKAGKVAALPGAVQHGT
jgi:hypothetical protein